MRRFSKIKAVNAQAALEYMLLLAVTVAVVLVGMQNYLPRTERAAELFFNETANVIFGRNPVGVPIPGGWGAWTACPLCGSGNIQTRLCNNPLPSGGGQSCIGQRQRDCVNIPCQPVDCQWGAWSGCACSPTPGTSYENRNCICPPPPIGALCQGPSTQACPFVPCPIPGCAWTPWGECCNVACCTDCYTCVDAYGCGLPDLTIACGAGGEQIRTCECAPGAPIGAYCPPDGDGVQTEKMCPGFDCSCPTTSYYNPAWFNVALGYDECTTVIIPQSTGTQAITVPCNPSTECSGGVTYACTDGQWNFVSESCGVRCLDGLCGRRERESCLDSYPGAPECSGTSDCVPCCGNGTCEVASGERCNDNSGSVDICEKDCGTCYCGDGTCSYTGDPLRGDPGREDCDNCPGPALGGGGDCDTCPTCAVRGGLCCPYGCIDTDFGSVSDPPSTCFQCCGGSGCNTTAPSCASLGGNCCTFGCANGGDVIVQPSSCSGGSQQCCTTSNCNPPPTCGSLGGSCCQYGCVSGDLGVTSDCADSCCSGGCAAQSCASIPGAVCCPSGCSGGDQGQLNCGIGNRCCTGGCMQLPCGTGGGYGGVCCGLGCHQSGDSPPTPPTSDCSSGTQQCCLGAGACYDPSLDSCGGIGGRTGETPFCCNFPNTVCASGDTPYPSNDCDVCCIGGNTESRGFCTQPIN